MKQIDNALLPKICSKLEELNEYEQFFIDYERLYKKDYQEVTFFSEHHCAIEEGKATL